MKYKVNIKKLKKDMLFGFRDYLAAGRREVPKKKLWKILRMR